MKRCFWGMLVLGSGLFLFSRGRAEEKTTLVVGAYTTPRESFQEIIPLFESFWKSQTGNTVEVQASYLGSGAQSRAMVGGFEADVAALSLETDITRLQEAGLITREWRDDRYKGMVSRSVVVVAVRRDNPKNVRDWADLAKPGMDVLTPNPKTSGGAQWNFLAGYGAARRGFVAGFSADDSGAEKFAKALLKNVSVMDKGARESMINFERGVGDAAITYENEVFASRSAGQSLGLVIPQSTLLIENPAAVVDVYADKHGTRAVAEAFVSFLRTPAAQRVFARHGYRPVDPSVEKEFAQSFPVIGDLWTIEYFGGWKKAAPDFFGPSSAYEKISQSAFQNR